MKEKQHKHKHPGILLFLPPVIILLFISFSYHGEIKEVIAEDGLQPEETQQELESEIEALEHEQIVQLLDQFMNLILQDIDETNQVINYHTKEELLDAFEKIAAREVAKPYVEFYFHEYEDTMYILPTEAPSWFIEGNGYDMIQLAENKYKLVQDNYMEMYGAYTMEIEFTYEDAWKITQIRHIY